MTDEVLIRPATRADLDGFYDGNPPPRSLRAWVAIWQGEVACVAGFTIEEGCLTAFSDVRPGIDAPRLTVWRTARKLFDLMRENGAPFVALANGGLGNAGKFLTRLGFEPAGEFDGKEHFVWRQH